MIFTMNVKDKKRKVVTETGVEPATNRIEVNRLNQLDHIATERRAADVDNITIPGSPFSRERDRNPLPFRVPLVFCMYFFDLSTSCIRP